MGHPDKAGWEALEKGQDRWIFRWVCQGPKLQSGGLDRL